MHTILKTAIKQAYAQSRSTDAKSKIKRIYKTASKQSHDRLAEREEITRELLENVRPDGRVMIIESGMDCDCVRYNGIKHLIYPSALAYDRLYYITNEWADGPFGFRIARPDENPQYSSRDLIAEATEDGHAHVVYA